MLYSLSSARTVFLSILVIFSSQLSKTLATYEECRIATTAGMFPGPTDEEVHTESIDQCQLSTAVTTCTIDLSNWEGYNGFQSICTASKGEVYELDYTQTCSSRSGTVTTINVVNAKKCVAPICTLEDMKTFLMKFTDGCTLSSVNIVSGSAALLGKFSLYLAGVLGGIGFLTNVLI